MTIAPSYENPPGVGVPFSAYSHVARAGQLIAGHHPQRQYPPNTLLIVQGLVRADLLVEIDATACRQKG